MVYHEILESLIDRLHESGYVEFIDISKEDDKEFTAASQHPEAPTLASYDVRLSRLIDILKQHKEKKKGIKSMLAFEEPERKEVEAQSIDDLYSEAEGFLQDVEAEILEFDSRLSEISERLKSIDDDIDRLEKVRDFDFSLEDLGTSDHLYTTVSFTENLEGLKDRLKSFDEVALYSRQHKEKKRLWWAVLVVAHKSLQNEVERALREYAEILEFDDYKGHPKEMIAELTTTKKDLVKEKKSISSDLKKYCKKHLNEVFALREMVVLERARCEVPSKFGRTDSTYIVECWAPVPHESDLKALIKDVSNELIIYRSSDPTEHDKVPCHLKTPWWAESYKMLLGLFSLPKYGEVNPTIPMGISFIIFFGLMLGDAGYGLCILLLSLFAFLKLAKRSTFIKSIAFLGVCLGLTTTVVGFLLNSFFGDFIPRFFYGDPTLPIYTWNIGGITLPLDSLKDPLLILTIALICGLLHLNLGIILGVIQKYKNKQYKEMVMDHANWFILQIGGGLLIGRFILGWVYGDSVFYLAAALTVVGLIVLMVGNGPIGFFDITGYVGDWLSYARLLALGLATAGMALAFNVVAQLFGEMIPVVGIVIMILLLVFAHLVNLALQALGAGVHSLRLQYVEMFNRFYGGGGTEFRPFEIKRVYTKVKEEM